MNWLEWLVANEYLQDIDVADIIKTMNLYTINSNELCKYKYFIIKNTRYDKEGILKLLQQERFIM